MVTDRGTWLMVGRTKNGLPRMAYLPPDAIDDLKHLPFTKQPRALYSAFEAAREQGARRDAARLDA